MGIKVHPSVEGDEESRTGQGSYVEDFPSLPMGRCQRESFSVAVLGEVLSHLRIHRFITRLPDAQTVEAAVAHAECRGDQDGIVDLDIGGPLCLCLGDVGRANALPS
jgi:hypothetical protein